MEQAKLTTIGSVIAAVAASLCCIGPAVVVLIGVGSIGAFAVFDSARPYLICLTTILIGSAFYLTYRKREVKCEDGSCKVEDAGFWNKVGVWSATLIAAGAISFPYFGIAVATALPDKGLSLTDDVSFLKVPLVCNAAGHLGCGSRAKFIMLDLMKDPAVEEAWLNRQGTVLAVVWNEAEGASTRETALKSVFSQHDLPIHPVNDQDRVDFLESFKKPGSWYKGSDVDALSIEEAGVIADRIVAGVEPYVSFKQHGDKQAFREDVKLIIQNCFLSLTSFSDLDDATYHRVESDIIAAGEKYLGKGNMPQLRMAQEECEHEENTAGCCSQEQHEK
jgi:hypothetical protein